MHSDVDRSAQLRAVGLRVTEARRAILDVLAQRPHSTADDVTRAIRDRIGGVSTQAVYDALRACADRGLLRRIEPAGSAVRYETRTGDNHHHLICRSCGRIVDVDCTSGTAPCLAPGDHHGFVVDEAELTFWGLCAECGAAAGTTIHDVPSSSNSPR